MRTRARWLLFAALAACGAPPHAPAPAARAVLPGGLAGCYRLNAGRGQPGGSHLYYAPPRFRLNADTVSRLVRVFARTRAWTLTRLHADGRPVVEERRQPVLYWAADTASDSIRIMFHTAHSGSELVVGAPAGADTLRGRAVEHWDVGPPYSGDGGPVAIIRIPCIAQP